MGEFTVRMMNDQTKESLFSIAYPNTLVKDIALTTLNIPEIQLDTNAKYLIKISSELPQPVFSIGLSDKQRIRGSLSQAGIPIEKDLLFQYSCIE